jgi:hypothetical protein
MSALPESAAPFPVIRRQRQSGLPIPSTGRPQLTKEEWDERQAMLQRQHAASFLANKEQQQRELKAARERKRYHGIKTSSELMDGVEEIPPAEAVMIAQEQEHAILPSRGPKTDSEGTVIDEGEVPIVRARTKRLTKVEQARARKTAQKKQKQRRVIM